MKCEGCNYEETDRSGLYIMVIIILFAALDFSERLDSATQAANQTCSAIDVVTQGKDDEQLN